jgi:hypothetical protein
MHLYAGRLSDGDAKGMILGGTESVFELVISALVTVTTKFSNGIWDVYTMQSVVGLQVKIGRCGIRHEVSPCGAALPYELQSHQLCRYLPINSITLLKTGIRQRSGTNFIHKQACHCAYSPITETNLRSSSEPLIDESTSFHP